MCMEKEIQDLINCLTFNWFSRSYDKVMEDISMLSNNDIRNAIVNKEIIISPYNEDKKDIRLTPAGFNLSFSLFIVSVNKKRLCNVFLNGESLQITIEPGDTILALTNEAVWVSSNYAGTLHSKVSYVSKGLGHISTTLDPGWAGQLLISISNPNNRSIDIQIGKMDQEGNISYYSFLTLCLYKLLNKANTKLSDNYEARFDIIRNIVPECLEQREVRKVRDILPQEARYFNLNVLHDNWWVNKNDKNAEITFSDAVHQYKEAHELFVKEMEDILKPTIKKTVSVYNY